jgi:hypothetical protein
VKFRAHRVLYVMAVLAAFVVASGAGQKFH